MVSLKAIRESNVRVATSLPPGLVAVFVGATSGIGETTLKHFAKQARKPRIYFLGRRESEGQRIQAALKELNPDGEYHYLKYDVSLIKNVDEVCRYIQGREETINLLFLTSGTLTTGKHTTEDLHYPIALGYYCRMRFIANLLPQIRRAPGLRRVVTVLSGGKEGKVFTDDLHGNRVSIMSLRGHIASITTIALSALAKCAPEVSFIHAFPGFVKTDLAREFTGLGATILKAIATPIFACIPSIPIDESGERHLYLATSARFPPRDGKGGDAGAVALGAGIGLAVGADGNIGGGVYSIDPEAEGTSQKVQDLMERFAKDKTAEDVWKKTEAEYLRIAGGLSAIN
ncbi:hypothetical protein F4861DRAFT_301313 [Xylaria intraflava]|nr:hypothetical protein F4861DRAFT_301313 [Xylaria intraflava]